MGKKDYGNILTTVIFSIFILAGLWTWENRGFLFGYFPHTSHVECVIMMQYCGKEKK